MTTEERFWAKVKIGNEDECWEWQGCDDGYGRYGRFYVHGKMVGAHRFAWELQYGPIPGGMCICHHCDNPPCVNVNHLFLATQVENMKDAAKKGRAAKGKQIYNAQFCEADIVKLRKLHTMGNITICKLALDYHVNHSSISRIISGEHWSHVVI